VQEATRELLEEHEKRLRAERLSTLGLFSSAIAHDLRNPLNTLSLALQWLKMRLGDHTEDRVQHRINVMQSEIRRAEQIIRTLLGFARTGNPERSPTNLNELARDVIAVVDPPPEAQVQTDLDSRLPLISVDRAQLFQVLENLVRNAIQAMSGRGVVTVTTRLRPDGCLLRVADTGPGVPEELHATIFEPLVTTKSTGTGLGLALCKRIVDAHGGEITLESRPGEGAAFTIELPLVEDPPANGETPAEAAREPAAA
jgi:signal transduction histidine kinase